jgi:hypothetical protein
MTFQLGNLYTQHKYPLDHIWNLYEMSLIQARQQPSARVLVK